MHTTTRPMSSPSTIMSFPSGLWCSLLRLITPNSLFGQPLVHSPWDVLFRPSVMRPALLVLGRTELGVSRGPFRSFWARSRPLSCGVDTRSNPPTVVSICLRSLRRDRLATSRSKPCTPASRGNSDRRLRRTSLVNGLLLRRGGEGTDLHSCRNRMPWQ